MDQFKLSVIMKMITQSKLGKQLLELGFAEPSVEDAICCIDPKFLQLSMEEFERDHKDIATQVKDSLSGIQKHRQETAEEISTSSKIRAIFTYGTLRSDFSKKGDRWGVLTALKAKGWDCVSSYGTVENFALFQNKGLSYPFAIKSPGNKIFGTLLTWPSGGDEAFSEALSQCNIIEGYDPDGNGLYLRTSVFVQTEKLGNVEAYIYYQNKDFDTSEVYSFPEGDWLCTKE